MSFIERLKNTVIEVASGENHFTMERGSFDYSQTISEWVRPELLKTETTETGFRSFYNAEDSEFVLEVREEKGLIKAALTDRSGSGYNRFRISFPADEDTHFYGIGETHHAFDLKGEKIRVFVAEHQNIKRTDKKMEKFGPQDKPAGNLFSFDEYESYYVQPTFTASGKWFLHAETKGYSEFDFTEPGIVRMTFQEHPVFWIGWGDTFEEVSEKLTSLVGRQPELPEWTNDGAILAVQGGTEVIDKKIKSALDKGVRVSGIWSQDWCGCRRTGFGYQVMWNWEWDKDLYKDLDKKIPEWMSLGIRFLGYINPFMAIERELYRYASEKGYCVKDRDGKDYLVTITTFPAAMIDLTNPEAWEWYKNVIKENMIGLGMGGWMADFGEYLPTDCVLYSGEDPEMLHNSWPALWAKLNREALKETGKEGEVFFFTRAGYTGTPEWSTMMWTGDQHVDWSEDDGISSVIPATLSLAMSGYGITHSDVGGYTTNDVMHRSRELLMRWEEMNAFSPLYRFHEGNRPVSNVQFDADDELLEHLARFSNIYEGLKPYIRDLEKLNAERGIPVMRPLFYHYDEERAYTIKDEYLLGRDILVAPVLEKGAVTRRVWLPEDRWINIFTGEEYTGGSYEIDSPIGKPPVFVRQRSECFENIIIITKTER